MDTEAARSLLGLPADGTLDPDVITAAYRDAARRHHPDRPGGSSDMMAMVYDAHAVLEADPSPPRPVQTIRRLTAADFMGWAPRVEHEVVEGVADVLRSFDEVLADVRPRPRPTVAPERPGFESERGLFHDTGWATDTDDTGLPYLVVQGIPVDAKLVVRAAGDRVTFLGSDGSTLTIDFAGQGDYQPPTDDPTRNR